MKEKDVKERIQKALQEALGPHVAIEVGDPSAIEEPLDENGVDRNAVTRAKFKEHKVPAPQVDGYHRMLETILSNASLTDFTEAVLWLAMYQDDLRAARLVEALMEWVHYAATTLVGVDKAIGTMIIGKPEELIASYVESIKKAKDLLEKVEAKHALEASLKEVH